MTDERGSLWEACSVFDIWNSGLADPLTEDITEATDPRALLLLPILELSKQKVLVDLFDRVYLAKDIVHELIPSFRRNDRGLMLEQFVPVKQAQHIDLIHERVFCRDNLMQIVLTLNLLLVNVLDVFLFDLVECGPVLSLSLRLEYLGLKIDLFQRPHTMMGIASTW